MKRFLRASITILALSIALSGCGAQPQSTSASGSGQENTSSKETVKLGFIGPLTGGTAQSGQAALNGATIAVEEINAAGGVLDGRMLELVPYDDKSSPEQAVTSTTKLIEVDHVAAIMGSLHSGNVLAAAPVAEEYKIPVVSGGTSPTWLEQGYEFHFRALGNSRLAMQQLTKHAVEQKWSKIAMIHSNDEYGNNGAKEFLDNASAKGLEIVADESFTHGDRDFTGQFAKIFKAEPDVVMTWAVGDDLGAVLKQIRQSGWTGPVIGPEGYTMPELVDIVGDAFYDVFFAAPYLVYDNPEDAPDAKLAEFLTAYKTKYKEKPSSDNAYRNYDAVHIIANAINTCGATDGQAIRDAIENTENLIGLAGTFNYKGNKGEGIDSVRLYKIEAGAKFSEIK